MIQHKRRLNEVISAKFTSPTGAPRPSAAGPAVRVSARIPVRARQSLTVRNLFC